MKRVSQGIQDIRSRISRTAKAVQKATSKRLIYVRIYSNSVGPEIIVAYLEEDVPSKINPDAQLSGYAKGVMIFTNRGDEKSLPKTGRIEDYNKIVKALKLSVVSMDKVLKIDRPYNDSVQRDNADFLRPLVLRYHQLVERFPGKLERRVVPQRHMDSAA